MVVETLELIHCPICPIQTKNMSEMTNHHLKTHALETANRIFESQVSKLMSKENLMDLYGFDAGSLKEIFMDKTEKRSFHVVQVLALNSDFIHISDGSCIVTNCIVACDGTKIRSAQDNCVIKIKKWSVIKIDPKSEPGQKKKQSEYGIKIESYEVLESLRILPMFGTPKVIQVTSILDETTDLDQIVINLLDNIIAEEDQVVEKKVEWCGKMLKILKKNENIGMWQCTVCRSRLSDKMDEKVVSHAQLHLRFFPGYRCLDPHKCRSETLLKYNKHLDESGHDIIQPEPLQIMDESVTEKAVASSKNAVQVTSVLEELANCFDSEFEKGGEGTSSDVVNEEDVEEDLEEETESVADVLADFFSVPNIGEEVENSGSDPGTKKDLDITLDVNSEIQSNSLVLQSSSRPEGGHKTKNLDDIVKSAQREAMMLTDSEIESDSRKFDWVKDVSSKIIMSGPNYECTECGEKILQSWSGQREILDHLSDTHLQRFRDFTCMICRIQSQSLRDFLDHLKKNHNKMPSRDFKRAVTGYQFRGDKRKIIEVDLDCDADDNAETPSKLSKCSTEDLKKREEEVMDNHLKVKPSNNESSPNDKDMRKVPSPVKTRPQILHQPFNWHREMTKSVAITKNKIKCLQCSAQLCSSNSAVSHLESFHFKELKGLKCPHCDIICDNLINYNNHVRMKHRVKLTLSLNKNKLTAIDESSSMALINESLVHNDGTTRPDGFLWQNEVMKRIKVSKQIYHCSDCDFESKPFSAGGGGDILNHIETQHMGIKGYSCPECTTVSSSFINFFQHLNKCHKIRLKLLEIL